MSCKAKGIPSQRSDLFRVGLGYKAKRGPAHVRTTNNHVHDLIGIKKIGITLVKS